MSEPVPEFSRLISTSRLSANGVIEILQAKPVEREALAKRFELMEISSLKAELNVQPGAQQTIAVTGRIEADFVQRCVVTLDPLPAQLALDINITFIPADRHAEGAGSPEADSLEEEFELYSNGKVDLGEMVAQQFGINLDPYPRKPDAILPVTEFGVKVEKPQPFAQLAKAVKNKDKTKD